MFTCVQLDANDIVYAVSRLTEPVNAQNIIPLPQYDETMINKKYDRPTGKFLQLLLSTDKKQITANNVNTATITATTDPSDTTPVNFQANAGTVYSVTPVNGVATFQFSTAISGDYTIKATSTKYGTNSVLVKAV